MPQHLKLQHSESIVIGAAAQIYSSYISLGKVGDDDTAVWIDRSVKEAIQLALAADDAIISDDEVESSGF
ncbi:hypothetical protein OAG51_03615 [Pirellulaceae bacterium]|jgi:hypothetical protein|nr:hypothetical protein [Mariniblastus sp.]MDB4756120.1 hypothetical protein [Mariniblastus sp.]MDB4794488.1 hypothetical protein [Pirellulaceae bacterium]